MDKQVRGYRLVERIGKGGFGEVYRAYQQAVEREVAIKVIMPKYANQSDFIRNFETEARMVARLEHPYVVPLFDYWREPNGAYLVMRYLRGGTLKQEMERGQLPLLRIAEILDNVCSALWTSHRNRVAHRDIKPANILFDDERRAYLSDFGLAINVGEDHYENLAGTWLYMPPERIQSQEQSHTVDIYSLGLVTYEMITGEFPFDRTSMKRLAQAHVSGGVPPIAAYREDVPDALDMVIQRATSKDPDGRYDDIRVFAKDFREIVQPLGTLGDVTQILPRYDEIMNPYLGLRPFSEADSTHFFGRNALVNQLLERLQEDAEKRNFLALVGPSGSGKSSAIYAGLLPQLRAGRIDRSETWYIASMIPGSNPFHSLVLALRSIAVNSVDDLTDELVEGASTLAEVLPSLLEDRDAPLLLFIDQFEEVFTQVEDEATRQHFLDLLTATIHSENSNVRIVITMRADFYDKPLRYERFGKLMQNRTEVILPLDTIELERAISGPAENVGLTVEPELIAEIISDVKAEPGALPLLQYTLTELFQMRDVTTLTLKTYRESGGIRGSLARRADEVYRSLTNEGQTIARQIFLRLVTLGEGTEDTRRRARYSELMQIDEDTDEVEVVLNTFNKHRLLTFDRDPETREPTVEVAHEALIREWRQFQLWLDHSRDDIRLQRLIASEVADWKEHQRDSSYLLRGNRLSHFEHWADSTNVVVSSDELEYIEASIQERKREEQIALEQHEKELALVHQSNRRQRVITLLLTVLIIGGGLLMLGIIRQRDNARQSEALAQESLQSAYSAALATTAQQALGDGDYSLALAFASKAVELDEQSTVAFNTLLEIAYGAGITAIIKPVREDETVYEIALSADGSMVASTQGIAFMDVFARYLPSAERAKTRSVDNPMQADFSTIDYTELPPPHITLHDTDTGELLMTLDGHRAPVTSLGFVPTDAPDVSPTQLFSASLLGEVLIWDIATGDIVLELDGLPHGYNRLSMTSDGQYMLGSSGADVENEEAQLVLWDVTTGERVREYPLEANGLWDTVMSPTGEHALSAYLDTTQIVWDVQTGEVMARIELENNIRRDKYQVALSEDGESGVTSLGGGSVYIWEIEEDELETEELSFALDAVLDVGLADDASRMLLLQSGGFLVDWNVEDEDLNEFLEERGIEFSSTDLSADGNIGVIGRVDGSILVWDLANQPPDIVHQFTELDTDMTASFLPSEVYGAGQVLVFDGDFEYADEAQTTLSIWDVEAGQVLQEWETPHLYAPADVIVDPTGQYALTTDMPGIAREPMEGDIPLMILWDIEAGQVIREMDPMFPILQPRFITLEDDVLGVLTGGRDGVRIWDVMAGTVVRTFSTDTEVEVIRSIVTPDMQYVFGTTVDGYLLQWDYESGDILAQFNTGGTSQLLALYAPLSWVVTSIDGNSIAIWDYDMGEFVEQLDAHSGEVLSVDFVTYEEDIYPVMISSGADGEVVYWDMIDSVVIGTVFYDSRVQKVQVDDTAVYNLAVLSEGETEVAYLDTPTLDVVRNFVAENRLLNPITLQDCVLFNIEDLCDEANILDS